MLSRGSSVGRLSSSRLSGPTRRSVSSAAFTDDSSTVQDALSIGTGEGTRRERIRGTSDALIKSKIDTLLKQEEDDEEEGEDFHIQFPRWKACCLGEVSEDGWWINSSSANALFGSVIVLNAIFLGVETDYRSVTESEDWLPWFLAESAFLAIFTVELLLRVRAGSCAALRDLWNIFDASLVSMGILDTWILEFIIRASSSELALLTLLRVIRLVRLVRILRVLRLFRFLNELTLLAQGILSAMLALGWSLLLILIVLYISAIFVTEAFASSTEPENQPGDVQRWFGSLGSTCLTLFQLMTLENWHQVVRGVLKVPGWGLSWLFFVPFIGLSNIVLLNVITGVVVERVLSCAAQHANSPEKVEMQQIYTMRELQNLFESMDTTLSGSITAERFSTCIADPEVVEQFKQLGFLKHELEHLVGYLAAGSDEEVRICDLVDGCLRIHGTAQSKHLLKVQFDILRVGRQSRELLGDLNRQVLWIIRRLERMEKRRREFHKQQEASRVDADKRSPPLPARPPRCGMLPQHPEVLMPAPPPRSPPPLLGGQLRQVESPASPSGPAAPPPRPGGQASQESAAAAWLHHKLRDLKSEQAVMSNLLGIFAGEMDELRTTVMELKHPVQAKAEDAEDSQSEAHSHSSSVIT